MPWRETREPGIAWLPLWLESDGPPEPRTEGEPEAPRARRGGAVVLIRMDPGCGYRPHRHVGTEDVLVLAGGYRDERGSYRAGDHVHYEPDSRHTPVALGDRERPVGPDNPACILYSSVPLGIELLGP